MFPFTEHRYPGIRYPGGNFISPTGILPVSRDRFDARFVLKTPHGMKRPPMRVLIIANPISGTGLTRGRIRAFTRELARRGHSWEIFLTTKQGDAKIRAAAVDGSFERIVVAGGDGTVNEVINGLPYPFSVPFLHLPTGTANMLAKELGIPSDIGELADMCERGHTRRLDMGLIGERRFLLLVSVGFDALVAKTVKQTRKETMGYMGYVWPIIKTLAVHESAELHITVDGEKAYSGANVMVLKVKYYGGYMIYAPDAKPDSGRFHLCIFHDSSPAALLEYATAALLNRVSQLSTVSLVQAGSVRIESSHPVAVEVDGDYYGTTPVDMRIVPAAVPALIP